MVDGFCEENFLDAKNIFEESINSGFELGGAICIEVKGKKVLDLWGCLLYTSPSPRDATLSRMPSSA